MKTCDSVSPFYGLPLPYPPSSPALASARFDNSRGDFACEHSFDCRDYPYDFYLPEDLYQEDDQMPEFDDSIIDDLLGDAYENNYLHQDYWYNDDEVHLPGFPSEPLSNAQFPVAYYGCPNHAVSCLKSYQTYGRTDLEDDYDRIFQVWSTSVANLNKLPNNFDTDSGKGCHSEGTLLETKNFGLYFGRSENSNLMEKDGANIFEDNVDHFSSGDNAAGKLFEDLLDYNDPCVDDLAPSLYQTERQKSQKQPVQNTSMAAETEESCSHSNCWRCGEQLNADLQQTISSLTAHVSRLEIQMEHLTHQVQDMADKLAGENKLNDPILDDSGDSEAVHGGSEIISPADDSDWEII